MEKVETIAKTVKGIVAACGAFLADRLGILYPMLTLLLLAMAADYVSGMIASKSEAMQNPEKGWSSKKGVLGIFKKVGYLLAIGCAVMVDYLIFKAAGQMGLSMPANTFFGLLVAIWFILNELLSILENVGRAGTPLPGFLQKLTAALKHTVEGKGDEAVPKETSEEK